MPAAGGVHMVDDYALALLLAANMDRLRGAGLDAVEAHLRELTAIEKGLTLDHYYAPYAHAELARVHMDRDEWAAARKELATVRNFKHYSNEQQLHMRLHVMVQELEERDRARVKN